MRSSVKVWPAAPYNQTPVLLNLFSFIAKFYHKGREIWCQFQIGHRERYSVERMLALRDYCQRTSPTRVFFVCLLTPMPAFIVAILIECIPLSHPADGWRTNYTFWIRLFLSCFLMAVGGAFIVKQVLAPGIISNVAIGGIGVGTAAGYLSCSVTLASLWKFPIPFGYVLMVGPFVLFFMGSLCIAIGLKSLLSDSNLRKRISPQLSVLAAQGALAGTYPVFFAVYRQLSGLQQTVFLLVMPWIKFISKQHIARVSAHLEEHVSSTIVFSVEVCNILYTVICMQTAVSSLTTLSMIVLDIFGIVIGLRDIYYQTNAAKAQGRFSSFSDPQKVNYLQVLPKLVWQAFHGDEGMEAPDIPIRVGAPFPLPLSSESKAFVAELCNAVAVKVSRTDKNSLGSVTSAIPIDGQKSSCLTNASLVAVGSKPVFVMSWGPQIAPARPSLLSPHKTMPSLSLLPPSVGKPGTPSLLSKARSSMKHLMSFLMLRRVPPRSAAQESQGGLQALFHSEYILMTEYIECTLPMLYTVYLALLFHLPAACYYPHMRSLTISKLEVVLRNMMLYSLAEFASFVGLNFLLKRKFGFSPLYQLAFVLETQACTLQSQLFVWVLCILQFTLVHNGVDLDAPFE